jgi:chromosome segregation ATPase
MDVVGAMVALLEIKRNLAAAESERAEAVRRYGAAEVRANDLAIELRKSVHNCHAMEEWLRQTRVRLNDADAISDAKEERLREAVGLVRELRDRLSEALNVLVHDLESQTFLARVDAWLARQNPAAEGKGE